MKSTVVAVLVAAALVSAHSTDRAGKPLPKEHYQLHLVVSQGEYLDNREAGTLKVLAEARLTPVEDRPFTFFLGGEAPKRVDPALPFQFIRIGRALEGKLTSIGDDKISLDVTLSHTQVGGVYTQSHIELLTESTRTLTARKVGEMVKVRWGKNYTDGKYVDVWVEVTVEKAK